MVREERHSEEEVRRVCVEIRRQAALENARWQLKAGYGGLALMSVVLVVVLWGGDSWRWWWLFISLRRSCWSSTATVWRGVKIVVK